MRQEPLEFNFNNTETEASVSESDSVKAGTAPVAESIAEPTVYTVSELTEHMKTLLEGTFPDVWVSGEVSNFRPHHSGHWFFRLKDDKGIIESVVFRGVNAKIPFKLENGMEVICHGRINVYAPHGKYSLVIDRVEPKGVGALQIAFEQLKKRLAEEGLFSQEHKKLLPLFPKKIGVVTAPTGAAIRDIINVIQRRYPSGDILVAPAQVQGEGAAQAIAEAIELLDRSGGCDVMIVGRGGGSIEDLWAFNEEVVARAIYACQTPIVSAVGHEIDVTIADFVADVRAATPSAAAELVVPAQAEIKAQVLEFKRQLALGLKRWWEVRFQRLSNLQSRLRPPTARYADLLLQIDHCRERLIQGMERLLGENGSKLAQLAGELQHLSPLAVLAKGYAVVSDVRTGAALRDASKVKAGDKIKIRLQHGELGAQVMEKK